MSYSCEISFKEICAEEVYDFLVTLKNKLIDNIENIAKDNYMYAPFVRYQHKPYSKLENYSNIECNNSWVKQVFTYRYFYLKEYNLLGGGYTEFLLVLEISLMKLFIFKIQLTKIILLILGTK